ncbi:uncharacterized protein LOC122532330 isoform X2 [Frieseomelitta varia]|uniref:uncharacterized protein LOC122532330 isoform X2 n=1 Tax=Frieseomelitta varia TaxID=561572 RepID=UPI001CB68022|nr:uncharacterized protein LOC122532330 isoform X2 [Frieseomelitta varia]
MHHREWSFGILTLSDNSARIDSYVARSRSLELEGDSCRSTNPSPNTVQQWQEKYAKQSVIFFPGRYFLHTLRHEVHVWSILLLDNEENGTRHRRRGPTCKKQPTHPEEFRNVSPQRLSRHSQTRECSITFAGRFIFRRKKRNKKEKKEQSIIFSSYYILSTIQRRDCKTDRA